MPLRDPATSCGSDTALRDHRAAAAHRDGCDPTSCLHDPASLARPHELDQTRGLERGNGLRAAVSSAAGPESAGRASPRGPAAFRRARRPRHTRRNRGFRNRHPRERIDRDQVVRSATRAGEFRALDRWETRHELRRAGDDPVRKRARTAASCPSPNTHARATLLRTDRHEEPRDRQRIAGVVARYVHVLPHDDRRSAVANDAVHRRAVRRLDDQADGGSRWQRLEVATIRKLRVVEQQKDSAEQRPVARCDDDVVAVDHREVLVRADRYRLDRRLEPGNAGRLGRRAGGSTPRRGPASDYCAKHRRSRGTYVFGRRVIRGCLTFEFVMRSVRSVERSCPVYSRPDG